MSDDASKLFVLLSALSQPNTEAIRNAERELKPILKDPRCVPALVEVLGCTGGEPQNEAIRQTAAVLLRKRLPSHYSSFTIEETQALKQKLLTLLAAEPSRAVRHGEASVASTVAKLEEAENRGAWQELYEFLNKAAMDTNPDARELAFFLLSELTETICSEGDDAHRRQLFTGLAELFSTALKDAATTVQKSALRALGLILSYLADEPEVECFTGLLPQVLQATTECLNRNDEDTVRVTLDVLYDLSYSPSHSITTLLNPIISFCLMVLTKGDIEMGVRDSAALVIATMAECKPKTFGKEEALVHTVVEQLFLLIENCKESAAGALFESNPAWKEDTAGQSADGGLENGDMDGGGLDDMDSPTETSMAQGTLDMLACELPKKYIFGPVMERCSARLRSPDANQRKAGIACLGVVAEGCAEPLRQHMQAVVEQVLAAAGDADSQVRECACFALGQLSEHCQPEILGYSERVLPIVFALLDDRTVSVQATSCYVLEMFCERLEPEGIRPLLDPLVRKLAAMLESTDKRSVQEMAVAALAATAVAAEEEFRPYIGGIAERMQRLMVLREESMYSLRGRALECMGHMAIAVGRDTFRPYFSPTMVCACDGLTLDSTDLHEFAYAVFANLSKVMGEEFAPVLPELVPHLTSTIQQDEGQVQQQSQAADDQEKQYAGLDDLDDDDDDEDGTSAAKYVLQVRTALLEAKKGAITAVGEMAAHTGAAYAPHLEVSMEALRQAARQSWHPLIKSECADAFPSLVVPMVAAHHNGELNWVKGDISGPNPMSAPTAAVASAVLTELLELMADDDADTAGKACEGVQSVIELCGPHALLPVAELCLQRTHQLITNEAPCQVGAGEEGATVEGAEDEGDDDHRPYMTSVCDLIGAYGRVMGDNFAAQLPNFLPPVCKFAGANRPASDRAMAMGCLGELAQEMPHAAVPTYWDSVFLPGVVAGLADSDRNVQRNAAFCAGVCAVGLSDAQAAAGYPKLMQALEPLFQLTPDLADPSTADSTKACVDNAAAAISRMMVAHPTHIPIGQAVPVLLKHLPLQNDMTENETVYGCILGLMGNPNAQEILGQNRNELQRVFQEATAEASQVDDEIKSKLVQALNTLG